MMVAGKIEGEGLQGGIDNQVNVKGEFYYKVLCVCVMGKIPMRIHIFDDMMQHFYTCTAVARYE